MDAMLSVFESTENEDVDYIVMMKQLTLYRDHKESFDKTLCHRVAQKLDPYEWWSFYGSSVPELQNLAMRILSQTSSSSGCERNWSLFERIHTKRRNRLEHQRLNDLVFTNYNLRLKHRSQLKKKISFDPIDYESIDKLDFWIAEEEQELAPEFDADDVTNLESAMHNENLVASSASERNNEGEEDMNISEHPHLNDDVGSGSGFSQSSPNVSILTPRDLNEINEDFGVDYY
ncbi:uncharacterized protein LOC129289919 [Prosopis cineraria]|uniref:uncharacterized protein LOC129289919 n=1 Tax=Prosopis cineraria TaxID=364024 RepID=UPI002410AD1A|nr:uncharacterized protein LOC129289919 [Prosopis cineraria]